MKTVDLWLQDCKFSRFQIVRIEDDPSKFLTFYDVMAHGDKTNLYSGGVEESEEL